MYHEQRRLPSQLSRHQLPAVRTPPVRHRRLQPDKRINSIVESNNCGCGRNGSGLCCISNGLRRRRRFLRCGGSGLRGSR